MESEDIWLHGAVIVIVIVIRLCLFGDSVVSCVEDCPAPAFISWSFRSVNLPAETGLTFDRDEPASTCFDVYFKLVQLGQHLIDADLSQVRPIALPPAMLLLVRS